MPLVTLDRVSSAYGHLPLLDNASLQIDAGERVCVIGRNGTGKSTLLRIIGGDLEPDSGSVWRRAALCIGRLPQDVVLQDSRPVFEVVADGLGMGGDEEWRRETRVNQALSRLDLDGDASVAALLVS